MSDARSNETTQSRTLPEKVTLAIALLLLAAIIGIVLFLWISTEGTPASFTISQGPVRTEGSAFYLPVTLTNSGDSTASQVMLEGRQTVDGSEEMASTTFDFVPGHSQVEGVLIFQDDPSDASLNVISYQEP